VVTLKTYRTGDTEPTDIKVTRATIEIPTVKTEQKGDTFIITLYSFNALAETKMQEAIRAYVKSGAKKMVLDMRGNPGGYLQSAVAIASYILPSGKVVLRESFADGRPEQIYRSQGKNLKEFKTGEIAVLIDGGSASAAEILAGALSQHDYATLIGTDSFGKGSVQELVPLPSGAALKVTIARWLTPDGTSISLKGLTPKIVVERTPEQRLANEDPQLKAAIEYLAGTYKPAATTSTSTKSN
jgi:carboxyl-terminal processing protease